LYIFHNLEQSVKNL